MKAPEHRRSPRLIILAVLLAISAFAMTASAGAGTTVTYTATQTIPVPPASNFAGSAGGDGWAVAMTPTAVYNVFHHNSTLNVACHLQVDATPCWTSPKTITQTVSDRLSNFAVSGEPGLWLDQPTGHLFVFATRTPDYTGGVVCIDTTASADTPNPFCGFTALTGAGEAAPSGYSAISAPAVVGSRWFAFNYVSGSGVTGAKNTMLCFDLSTLAACGGQPFTLALGDGTVSTSLPSPSVAAAGTRVIVPINIGEKNELGCFDGATLASCAGDWPAATTFYYNVGGPFPLLSPDGAVTGVCLPVTGAPCFNLSGASVASPTGLAAAISPNSSPWNGPAFVLGPRVYVPNGNTNQVHCYDYNLSSSCANFPKSFDSLGYLYTVNSDPQRPACIWVNADNGGKQIQNFDAFTGGACGAGAIRVLASASVVATELCTPGSWTSLQVTTPPRDSYSTGSVAFQDGSGNSIPGAADVALDNTGTADLRGLDLSSSSGLPQFLITLTGAQGKPGEVVVKLTWTGNYDPSCATKPGTVVVNPPTGGGGPAGGGVPAKADLALTLTGPVVARVNKPFTYTAVVKNNGPDTSTGDLLKVSVPTGTSYVSSTTTKGSSCYVVTSTVFCPIGTLGNGESATVNLVFLSANAGPINVLASLEGDGDPNVSNNSSTVSGDVLSASAPPPAPPAPTQPGTFNALTTGTVLVNGVAVPSDVLLSLKSGDLVDVTNGVMTFITVQGWKGTFSSTQQTAHPRRLSSTSTRAADATVPSSFQLTQGTNAADPAVLKLTGGDFAQCTAPRRTAAASPSQPVRRLWGAATGKFQTTARFSAATIRGTIWLTEDQCGGSLTTAVDNTVDVLDLTLNKTVAVGPGQSYLAKAKAAAFKPPKKVKKVKKVKKPVAAKAKPTFYVVRPGDSLYTIAAAKLGNGNRWQQIVALNKLAPPYKVEPGMRLRLPRR